MAASLAARVERNRFTQVYDEAMGHNARRLFAGVKHGSRNNTAFFLARFLMFYVGFDYETTLDIMEKWNTRNKPPMDLRELQATVKSATRYPYLQYSQLTAKNKKEPDKTAADKFGPAIYRFSASKRR
jgi:hypothetical protein